MITMTETLFGGMLIVVLAFFVARRAGLSSYWSATLAGALPFLAYLGISAKLSPAGDVLAIHLVVFMATAAILGVFTSVRKRQEKMHWAPKAIITFFIFLAMMNAFLVSTATNGLPEPIAKWLLPSQDNAKVHTVFPGTVPHDPNKLYESHQERVDRQRKLGWQVDIEGLDALKSTQAATLILRIKDADQQPVLVDRVYLGFWRMANSKDDMLLELVPGNHGEYHAEVLLPNPGRWVVEIGIARGEDIYQSQKSLLVDEPV